LSNTLQGCSASRPIAGVLRTFQGLQAINVQKGYGDRALIHGSWLIAIRNPDYSGPPAQQNHLRVSNVQDGPVGKTNTERREWPPIQKLSQIFGWHTLDSSRLSVYLLVTKGINIY